MRTQQEILKKINTTTQFDDSFGVIRTDLLSFLTYENAKPFLKEEAKESDWEEKKVTEESIKAEIREYLPFAWGKANDLRGLSANRSVNHMEGWAWLLGDKILEELEAIEYKHYGKEKLIYMSELVNFDWKAHDNGERIN